MNYIRIYLDSNTVNNSLSTS